MQPLGELGYKTSISTKTCITSRSTYYDTIYNRSKYSTLFLLTLSLCRISGIFCEDHC